MISDEKRKALRAARPARKAAQQEAKRVARARKATKHGSHHRCTPGPGYGTGRAHPARGTWTDPWYWAPDIVVDVQDTHMVHICEAAVNPDNGTYPTPARIDEPEPGHRGTGEVLSWNDKSQHMGYESRK